MQIGAVAVLILLCAGNALFLFLAIVEFHNPRPPCLSVPIP